jgi:hypothetical protein
MDTPEGTTHTMPFYGSTHFFKRTEYDHLNQVSEQWETLVSWSFWNGRKWVDSGPEFSDRRLTPL